MIVYQPLLRALSQSDEGIQHLRHCLPHWDQQNSLNGSLYTNILYQESGGLVWKVA